MSSNSSIYIICIFNLNVSPCAVHSHTASVDLFCAFLWYHVQSCACSLWYLSMSILLMMPCLPKLFKAINIKWPMSSISSWILLALSCHTQLMYLSRILPASMIYLVSTCIFRFQFHKYGIHSQKWWPHTYALAAMSKEEDQICQKSHVAFGGCLIFTVWYWCLLPILKALPGATGAGIDIKAGEPLALDSKAALGLAIPNLPAVETKTTN